MVGIVIITSESPQQVNGMLYTFSPIVSCLTNVILGVRILKIEFILIKFYFLVSYRYIFI